MVRTVAAVAAGLPTVWIDVSAIFCVVGTDTSSCGDTEDSNSLGGGGSAMPCGLVSPAARANVALALWLPEVRPVAAAYWYTLSVPLSTIQMLLTLVGSMVIPVGCAFAGSMVQLPSAEPETVYLNTLSVV